MIEYLIYAVIAGFILTCFTVRFRKLCGYIAFFTILLISIGVFYIVYQVFSTSSPVKIDEPLMILPVIGAQLVFNIDKMGALFLSLIAVISLLASLYSIDYMDSYKEESLLRFYPFLILFVLSMIGVVIVSDLFFFFVFWEFMTLSSYFLVIFEKKDPVVLKAGFKYFLMTHIGTALMFIAAFVLQSYAGTFRFDGIEQAIGSMAVKATFGLHIVLALFFIGFATKSGVYPFGTWLPDAHPAAPSGISAMLSGVMIKMGIFGILRIFLYILPVSDFSVLWGIIIAVFGTLSILIGTFNALVQKDSKRLLAFHSIGQIGYVLLAVGIGISFMKDNPAIATIALIAGLFHMINHAFFKSLLFLNAGSILFKTGIKNLNNLGGLWNIIPLTAVTALVASLSISGIPPFNGFVSKWLIYQVSILGGIKVPLFVSCGVVAIFLSAITMASFIKFFSTSFLGDLPCDIKDHITAKRMPAGMNISQIILALICLGLGLAPLFPVKLIYDSLAGSKLADTLPQFGSIFNGSAGGIGILIDGKETGVWKPLVIVLIFLGLVLLSYLISKLGGSKKRVVPVWLCGEEYDREQVRYRAHSFYLSLQHLIEGWFFPKILIPGKEKPERVYNSMNFDNIAFYPLARWIVNLADKIKKSHSGIPQIYMLWQVLGVIIAVTLIILAGGK